MPLRNSDYTDRELLFIIADAADDDGLASSDEIGQRLGLSENGSGRSRAGKVATRLGWMVRYGFVERVDPREADIERDDRSILWRITPIGIQIMGGRLTKPIESALGRMGAGEQVLLMRGISERIFGGYTSRPVADAVRREYLHQYAKRKR